MAQGLKRVRRAQGASQLTTLEAQAIYDGAVLADLKPDEHNRAKELIEYFMIAANGVVAQYLEAQQLPVAAARAASAGTLATHRRARARLRGDPAGGPRREGAQRVPGAPPAGGAGAVLATSRSRW